MHYEEHDYASSELEYKHFLRPALEQTMADIHLEDGATILDAGCGPGATFEHLATLGDTLSITGIDGSATHLASAEKLVNHLGLTGKVKLVRHDLFQPLPFADESFDLIWISDVLFPDDTGEATWGILEEFKRVLRKGGQLIIFYGNWLRLTLLPGYSLLENSIHTANELSKSSGQGWASLLHPESCQGWLKQLDFKEVQLRMKSIQYQATLEPRIKKYIHWHIDHIYRKAVAYESKNHSFDQHLKSLFERLIDPKGNYYLLDDPDYWCNVAPVVAYGRK